MNTSCMKNVIKKLAFPLVACGFLVAGSTAHAQTIGDICSIHPGVAYTQPIRTSGSTVDIRIRLFSPYGNFTRQYLGGLSPVVADVLSPFQMRVVTGNGIAYAKLTEINNYNAQRTELRFQYTVRSGDLAFPMTIYGNAGSSAAGDPFQFNDGQWRIYNIGTTNDVVWRYTLPANMISGEVIDEDFSVANVRLQTLSFETVPDPWTVQATKTLVASVNTDSPVSNTVPFYVWSANTNIAQIVEQASGDTSALLYLSAGSASTTFRIKGKAIGSTLIYMSPAATLTPGLTNYVTKTVVVSDPPPPTVSVTLSQGVDSNGLMRVTLDESDSLVQTLKVSLSETYADDLWVRLDTIPALQTNIVFDVAPMYVKVSKNTTESSLVSYTAKDGLGSIRIVPVLTNVAANAYYTIKEEATVVVRNVKPAVSAPVANSTVRPYTLTAFDFPWEIADVAADTASGMTVTWSFGDGTTNEVSHGAIGTKTHTYEAAGTYTVTVTARDKDGSTSDPISFFAVVADPVPRPTVTVVPGAARYNETNGIGSLFFSLSKAYVEDVYVSLSISPAGQSNIVMGLSDFTVIERGKTNSEPISFAILDGTPLSKLQGLVLTPVLSNNTYYSARAVRVYVDNQQPNVVKPVAGSTVGPIPATVPYSFPFDVRDVDADLASLVTSWDFGDGSDTLVLTGATGRAWHTFTTPGTNTVRMTARDKDYQSGDLYQEVEFTVVVGTPPAVSILTPSGAIYETPNAGEKDYIEVELSSAYTNAVTVSLAVTPANSTVNGTLTLEKYQVVFPAGNIGEIKRQKVYIASVKDGTDASSGAGFTITPTVIATAGAVSFYGAPNPGDVRILNVPPTLNQPAAPTTVTEISAEIPQNGEWTFYWDITDVSIDAPLLQTTWYWGDGTTTTVLGRSGNVSHIYTAVGDITIHVVTVDKDGGSDDVYFKVRVSPAKSVNVTPVGPVLAGAYASAPGLGNGLIFSEDAVNRYIQEDVYFFKYTPGLTAANVIAVPYKTSPVTGSYRLTNYIARVSGLPGSTAIGTPDGTNAMDSFFYTWVGADQGLPEEAVVPLASPVVSVSLPASQTTGTTGGSTSTSSVEIRQIQAVFSREYRGTDNIGDINNDGIPDPIAIQYGFPTLLGSDLISALGYNGDADYLPGAASDNVGLISGSSNTTWAAVGRPFTAFLEIRGYHEGLNNPRYNSNPDYGPGEEELLARGMSPERPTSPITDDTDGDGYPDGWEYYFWYNAAVNGLTGRKYNPQDIASGALLDWPEIYAKFDPIIPATDSADERDLDGDGLLDIEELATGTNPIHWDSDGDGMCDGWEVLRGLNPSNPDDGLKATASNPDGDYMAIATVPREFVTISDGDGNVIGTYLRDAEGNVTTWYNYGTSNAPIAVGRPVALPAGDEVSVSTNALVLHFQVYQEFGFDPRTAWTRTIGRFPNYIGGAAPNTKPFTSLDEYLLMKFMSENRVNGATASMLLDRDPSDWVTYSTHPLTPDSEEDGAGMPNSDGMPDGWELYVACAPGTRVMAINPWIDDDAGATDSDGDRVNNVREFAGTDSSAAYASAALYNRGSAAVSITRPAGDANWINKFWPTDPWNPDTDGDAVSDYYEAANAVPVAFLRDGSWWTAGDTTLQYANGVVTPAYCVRGGGLNPCSMDSDWDGLPDAWEYDHAGTNAISSVTGNAYIEAGMDGTHGPANLTAWSYGDAFTTWDILVTGNGAEDRNMDFDRDGLENYQEYWVQAVRHFRYDYTDAEIPMDGSMGPDAFFTPNENIWDFAQYAYWFLPMAVPQPVMLPAGFGYYVSTDPREPDSDFDGMDDYYEMFHGLNPILGDPANVYGDRVANAYGRMIDGLHNGWNTDPDVALPMDFMQYPWLAGMDEADPDADGLRNLEEQIQPDTAAPSCSNTDPSPIWMTDVSSLESFTARFYGPGTVYPWSMVDDSFKVFTFEMNEGYDTDNDGVSDKAELLQTSTAQSEPQDQDDPLRRQAIWFDGVQSAAQTLIGYSFNEWAFRSFTVEFWTRPEVVNRDQILIERPIVYGPSDLSTTGNVVRLNFRVGIAADGRVYALFQNAGVHDDHTGRSVAYGRVLNADEWVHIAARMDGAAGKFELFINGQVQTTVATSLIPANGVINILSDPDSQQYPVPYSVTVRPGLLVLGAGNLNPAPESDPAWTDYTNFFQGYMDEVRVWDGARNNNEILENYTKRFNTDDLELNRSAVAASFAVGGSRVAGVNPQLPAELIYHYTFDNMFSAGSISAVAKVPRGFNYWQVVTNRPVDYVVGWWDALPTHSMVYDQYGYVPWIENGVEHLPMTNGNVRNSIFWSNRVAGELQTDPSAHGLTEYDFPNNGNPYGLRYTSDVDAGGQVIASDLLPLGNAWSKQAAEMWDDGSPSGVWAETGDDLDADGLADWWEALVATTYPGVSLGWYDLYPDGSGMTAGEKYLRDIAAGWQMGDTTVSGPTGLAQSADADNDGLPDWWENIYNLKVNDSVGANGSLGDPDSDGLSNYAEYLISEKYPFNRTLRPNQFKSSATQTVSDYFLKSGYLYYGQMFADHDFMEDWWEDQYQPEYVNRFVFDPQMDNDDDGWSNWAECRYSSWIASSSPERVARTEVDGDMEYHFPIPVVETLLRYQGVHANGNIVINAYSTPSMDGQPTATYLMGFGANATTAPEKSYPLGYWENRIAIGTLSPGSVEPGTINFTFTDMWTGISSDTGFDFNGILYAGSVSGYMREVGTVNYETGEFSFDLGEYEGSIILLADEIEKREDYIDCEISYVEISYSVVLPDAWPKRLYLGRADSGHLREGANYFFAFMDLDNNGVWGAGEPCGVTAPFATDVGWDRNMITIDLTDYTPSFLRFSLSSLTRSEDVYFGTAAGSGGGGTGAGAALATRIRVLRKSVDGNLAYRSVILDKTVDSTRNYMHEGDVLEVGQFGLDWGLTGVPTSQNRTTIVYEIYKGDMPETALTNGAIAVFTNTYDLARAKAVTTYPINGSYVYSSRPTFKWTMPKGYTAFAIELKVGSSTGTTVYNSGAVQAPARDSDGNCIWEAPIYADGRLPGGQIFAANKVYAWRVMALNSKFYNTTAEANWSDWKLFRLDVNAPIESSGYGALTARVKYHGPATSLLANRVKVQAFRTASFTGLPVAEYTLTSADLNALTSPAAASVNVVLKGLALSSVAGEYYVRAFIDHNTNTLRDVWESWGYANYYGASSSRPYDPRKVSVTLAPKTEVVDITIEDADSDQDWFPDAWEYEKNPSGDFLNLVGPSPAADADTEVNPWLSLTSDLGRTGFFIALSAGTTDLDADGLGDLAELALGSDADATSSSGDGYADGDKLALGLAPADTLSLSLTGLDAADPLNPVVQWSVGVQKASGVNRSLISALSTVTGGVVGYEIIYTPSLSNPQWRTVKAGTVTLSGVQTLVSAVESAAVEESAKGFFRVRLVSP